MNALAVCSKTTQTDIEIELLSRRITRVTATRQMLKGNWEQSKRATAEAKDLLDTIQESRVIVQETVSATQKMCYEHLGNMVTKCLSAVFHDPYTFRLKFEQNAGRTQVSFVFLRNDVELDPMSSTGGGVVDIASFALRIAALLMQKPSPRQVLILDEPFRFVSAEYREQVRELIEELASEIGIQFILVTHMEELQCGTVVKIS